MKNKKFSWKNTLNSLIGCLSLVLVALIISVACMNPLSNFQAKALTKADIINGYNISFNSAKTKVRTASSYSFTYEGDSYEYMYSNNEETRLYSEVSAGSEYSSEYGSVSLQANSTELKQYIERERVPGSDGYIPGNVTHFRNVNDELEPIFYSEIDENDFAILSDNYRTPNTAKFNVENLYLSFGSPASEVDGKTKLADLTVTGELRTAEQFHILNIDSEIHAPYTDEEGNTKSSYYWYQYFDLNNVTAKLTGEQNSPTYKVIDPSGQYKLTFTFQRILPDGTSTADESFTYTFYLLDSADYNNYPEILNATLGYSNKNTTNEYFYNFAGENPSLLYSPSRYNISYTRQNNEITENITSVFTTGIYTNNATNQQYGKITFYNNEQYIRDVYILTNYSNDNTVLEYLYVSNTKQDLILSSFNDAGDTNSVINLLNADKLEFEYKLVTVLEENSEFHRESEFTTTTYITEVYSKLQWIGEDLTDLTNTDYYTVYTPATTDTVSKTISVYDNIVYYYNPDTDKLYRDAELTVELPATAFNYTPAADDLTIEITDGIFADTYSVISQTHLEDTIYFISARVDKTYYLYIKDRDNINTREAKIYIDSTHNTPAEDFEYTYNYGDDTLTITDGELSGRSYTITYEYTLLNKTSSELKHLLNPDTIAINYTYEIKFKELGVYTYEYNYICPWYNNATGTVVGTRYSSSKSVSTNRLTPYDYTLEYRTAEVQSVIDHTAGSEGSPDNKLFVTFSGYLNAENQVTINSKTYKFDPSTNTITVGAGTYTIGQTTTTLFGTVTVPTLYTIESLADGIKLYVRYQLGTVIYTTTPEKAAQDSSFYNYKYKDRTVIDYELSAGVNSTNINNSMPGDSYFYDLIRNLELQHSDNIPLVTYRYERHNQGADKLSIFGSIAYFSKEDASTDSGYAILEQIDSKEQKYFISDFTSLYVSMKHEDDSNITTNLLSQHTPTAGFSATYVGNGSGQVPLNQIIVTDTQVFWKNYSTLLYNGKISQSRIYKYTNYKDIYGNLVLSADNREVYDNNNTYFKDIYCKDDGYYEVIIKYTYTYYKVLGVPEEDTVAMEFYQLFTFIIDNNSPKITFEVETDELDAGGKPVYETLLPSSFTNKVVRISWLVPTYFQNNIYIEVDKQNFDGVTTDLPFLARFDGENPDGMLPIVLANTQNETYVRSISTFTKSEDKSRYYVTFRLPADRPDWNLDGHYNVTIYYGTENTDGTKPSVTQKYTSDNKKIAGMTVVPVMLNDQGYYIVNDELQLKANQQIVNTDFTFRYSPKASGAQIFTYWHKITFTKASDYDELINASNDKQGITTNFALYGTDDEINIGKLYNYNYETTSRIANGNYFTSPTSCMYLFRMKDQAGNECRYVIFYDTTAPRFLVDPKPNNKNNIVSDVTTVTWGDYKAIKVNAADTLSLLPSINEYTKIEEITPPDRLQEALSYINGATGGKFNNAKIEKIEDTYYILIPIQNAQITDEEGKVSAIKDISRYYFFPNSPIVDDTTIKLPALDASGKIIVETAGIKFENHTYDSTKTTTSTTYDFYGDVAREYISTVYGTNNTALTGVSGTGLYYYAIFDELGNNSLGDIWMNLDKTQTLAYATFTNSETITTATGLTGEAAKSYAAAKLYISSLQNTKVDQKVIPDYKLSYTYHAYNATFYENYAITNVEYIKPDAGATDLSAYLRITYTGASDTKVVDMKIFDEDNNRYHAISYPYDMQGSAIISDTQGNPKHIYDESLSDYITEKEDLTQRIFSSVINPSVDTSTGEIITQEGLYIFKREYDKNIAPEILGTDTRVIYRIYYVDRNGIISVPVNDSAASSLYNIGSDIEFLLGSNYKDTDNQKLITANNIQNNQVSNNTSYSNSSYTSANLFTTNKVETKFTLTTDKYNFASFHNSYIALQSQETELATIVKQSLLNKNLFESIFKLDLVLNKGANGTKIIDETNVNATQRYNSTLMKRYITEYQDIASIDGRLNENSFFYGDPLNAYYITLSDQSGHILREPNDRGELETKSTNHQPNNLQITFNIKHVAPSGEMYGKYYGEIDYDEDNGGTSASIPITTTDNGLQKAGSYALISHYLNEEQGQLKSLSDNQTPVTTASGSTVSLLSTNNETLVFLFAITNDEYMAKIDINNIQVYQNGMTTEHLLFNRSLDPTTGVVKNHTTKLVPSQDRQNGSFICNVIGDTTYYAIIIFDNNLEKILDEDEKTAPQNYHNFRLLDSLENVDLANYYIKIHYVGEEDDYQSDLEGNTVSYFSTTYEITVDRIKPKYNLVQLMALDRYTYKGNTVTDSKDYELLFDELSPYYNFKYDEKTDFYNSDLENYFFAIDSRASSSFTFKSVDKLDSVNGFYIRPLSTDGASFNIKDYKFSYTPDDYVIYNDAQLRGEHNQFVPSNATSILFDDSNKIYYPVDANRKAALQTNQYYYCPYIDGEMSVNHMLTQGILKQGNYYEILECDEAGNYRVYGIYVHDAENDNVKFRYQAFSGAPYSTGEVKYSGSIASIGGITFNFTNYSTGDLFIKGIINVQAGSLQEQLYIYYNPITLEIKVTDISNNVLETIDNVTLDVYVTEFLDIINEKIAYYNTIISDKSSKYYSEYGYIVDLTIVDRLGIPASYDSKILNNYIITYSVAGSEIVPEFTNKATTFEMYVPSMKGSTYITKVKASQFNKTWLEKDVDSEGNQFTKHSNEFKTKGARYILTKGVYRFEITDNFGRTSVYFHEFGISSSQTGGSIRYYGNHTTHTDNFTYTGEMFSYTYDSSIYDVFIRYTGEHADTRAYCNSEEIYGSNSNYTNDALRQFGIQSVITNNNITTITFVGVSKNRQLSKYEIKTILASTATDYTWGDELTNNQIFVYDYKMAIYNAIPQVTVRNMKGVTLDTSTHLNLTEDFQLVLNWGSTLVSERIDFNTQIELTRKYTENNVTRTAVYRVSSEYIVTLPGEYTAKAVNSLGKQSATISFTRGDGEISMYAVYAVTNQGKSQKQLEASSYTTVNATDNKTEFHYFITDDYFNYIDLESGNEVTKDVIYDNNITLSQIMGVNKQKGTYLDVRVNSNLNLNADIISYEYIDVDGLGTQYEYIVKYQIYSNVQSSDSYIYRYAIIHFLPSSATYLIDTTVVDIGTIDNRLVENENIVQSVSANGMKITFTLSATSLDYQYIEGNTLYLERYYNNELIETVVVDVLNVTEGEVTYSFNIKNVGLHQFAVRDLAGRQHIFTNLPTAKNNTSLLYIYLINQILYEVNNETPINNQVFNDAIKINIISELDGLTLYNAESLGITVYRNGVQIPANNEKGVLNITEPGYYTIEIVATTELSSSTVANQEIASSYSFAIIRNDIARNSFNISKGSNFVIENVTKIVMNERYDVTEEFKVSPNGNIDAANNYTSSLIWLSYSEQQNSHYEITLKSYNTITNSYVPFSFKVWINDEKPVIQSNIESGINTRSTIELYYNPGLIFEQVGACTVEINGVTYATIDENSEIVVNTITINKSGEYLVKVISDDGTILSTYKYIKTDPINGTTKLIIIVVSCAVVGLVILFFLIRKKGKYR